MATSNVERGRAVMPSIAPANSIPTVDCHSRGHAIMPPHHLDRSAKVYYVPPAVAVICFPIKFISFFFCKKGKKKKQHRLRCKCRFQELDN